MHNPNAEDLSSLSFLFAFKKGFCLPHGLEGCLMEIQVQLFPFQIQKVFGIPACNRRKIKPMRKKPFPFGRFHHLSDHPHMHVVILYHTAFADKGAPGLKLRLYQYDGGAVLRQDPPNHRQNQPD